MVFLFLSKGRNFFQGYTIPNTIPVTEYLRSVKYDISVVENWLSFLNQYSEEESSLKGKEVLELGPGSDLGVGLYLLSKGVARYSAIDINNLVATVPTNFYEIFFEYLHSQEPDIDIDYLRQQLLKSSQNNNKVINYVYRKDFDILSAVDKNSIDLIFSNAAFEHFDTVEETIRQISIIAKPKAKLISEIDLQTHSRWIRDKDPNNIYRYSDRIYHLFNCKGIPNRLRPCDYETILQRNGWENIIIYPTKKLSDFECQKITPFLNYRFQNTRNQMHILSFMLCATQK